MKATTAFILVLAVAIFAGCAGSKSAQQSGEAKGPEKKEGIKPYTEVITKEAKSDTGVFIVHKIKQKYFYEIPNKVIGKDFLLVTSQAKTQTGIGYGGDNINSQDVRWDRDGDRILLRSILYSSVAKDSLPVYYAVQKATFAPILAAFDIQALNKDSSTVVIDVSELYTSDIGELSLGKGFREAYKVRRLDNKRSYVTKVKTFPRNLETEAVLTYDAGQVPEDYSLSTISMVIHHSMVLLPEKPIVPRLADDRVGYFEVSQVDYGYPSQRAERRRFITKWRLEPKDTAAFLRGELVDPVTPIVFYIDRGVPDKWRPWLKKGVESWQVAFEKAGFKNAILAKDPPSEKDDPNWAAEDARYASIRWLPSEIENAYGPSIADPRTGEILDADIGFFHNVMNLADKWFFVQAGCLDPRAAKLPIPDSLAGELLQYISAHEVGHSLGFQHNMKATSQYPVDSLRRASFTARYGTEASIMDYGRFNYVAQPGDNARLIPMIGPYDKFAVEWGYRPFIGVKTPDEEKEALARIAARQEREPYLRFGSANGIDPSAQTEDLGNDAVAATKYGMMNINRIAKMLLTATTKPGEDYSILSEFYNELFSQRNRELGHVANQIGGIVQTTRVAGQEGVVHTPVPAEKQKEAMAFIVREGFRVPLELIDPAILSLIEPTGSTERVLATHRQLLNIIMNNGRLGRLITTAALAKRGTPTYTLREMLLDLRKGVWSELSGPTVAIDLYRRNLQRAYIDIMGVKLTPQPAPTIPPGIPASIFFAYMAPLPMEARSLIRKELLDLDAEIAKALPRTSDPETRAHLEDSRYQISKILFPEKKG